MNAINISREVIVNFLITKGVAFIVALLIVFVGFKVSNYIVKMLEKLLKKSKCDETIANFLIPFSKMSLKVLVLISVISYLGVVTTSFVAIIGGASFAIGLAFQGSLSNFAGGVLLLILKPFKVGDYINVNGISGTVKSISIFYTHLTTPDNKIEIIPNSMVSNSNLTNFSANNTRRVDLIIGVDYDTDIKLLKNTVKEIIKSNEKILSEPSYFVGLSEFGDSSLNFSIKFWVKTSDYWDVYFKTNENINEKFNEVGISFPYPHMDVNIIGNNQ
ncbi:mechanosensitive ion channel [Clostridiaceae bacterium HSG29]|nr:mechanosensitive ion channel [Clostridiaceae bacterium HSG29]